MNERLLQLANKWDEQAGQTMQKALGAASQSLRYFYTGSALSLNICADELRKEAGQR